MSEQLLVLSANEPESVFLSFVNGDLGNRQMLSSLTAVLVKMLPSPDV